MADTIDSDQLTSPLVPENLPIKRPEFTRLDSRRSSIRTDSHVWGAICNLSLTAVGTIVLNLPSTIEDTGWALGILFIIFFAILTDLSLVFLVKCSKAVREQDYEAVGRALFGPFGGRAVKLALLTLLFGCLVTVLIILADLTTRDLGIFGVSPHAWYSQKWFVTLVPILISLPLAFASELHALRHTSLISFFVLAFILAAVLYTCLTGPEFHSSTVEQHPHNLLLSESNPQPELDSSGPHWASGPFPSFSFTSKSILALPSYALAFCCQFNIIPLYYQLPVQSRPHINFVIHTSMFGVALPLYIVFACVPFFYLGPGVPSDFLTAWKDNKLIAVCQGLLAIVSIFKIPLLMLPLREVLCETVFGAENGWATRSKLTKSVIVAFIFGGTATAGCTIGDLSRAVNIVGCTSGMLVCFILPCLFFLKMIHLRRVSAHPILCSSQVSSSPEVTPGTTPHAAPSAPPGMEESDLEDDGRGRSFSELMTAETAEDEWEWAAARRNSLENRHQLPHHQMSNGSFKWWALFSVKHPNTAPVALTSMAVLMGLIGVGVGISGLIESFLHWKQT